GTVLSAGSGKRGTASARGGGGATRVGTKGARPGCSRPKHRNATLGRQVFWLSAPGRTSVAPRGPRTAFPRPAPVRGRSGVSPRAPRRAFRGPAPVGGGGGVWASSRASPITAAAPQRIRTVFPILPAPGAGNLSRRR